MILISIVGDKDPLRIYVVFCNAATPTCIVHGRHLKALFRDGALYAVGLALHCLSP